MAAQSPLQKVPEPLRRHLHLKSRHQYPVFQQLRFNNIIEYLSNAGQVVRNVAPMQWTIINCPADGNLMLVWQAPEEQGFGSDGYVWGDVENTYSENHGRFILEVCTQRTGYRPGEALATHARHRYRLRPTDQEGLEQYDPSLWLVHWCRAAQNDHAQAERVPISGVMKALMEERKVIEKSGFIVRKDFMLHDTANYPAITMPPPLAQFFDSRISKDGEPAAKRAKHERPQRHRIQEVIEDEAEDRDLFDMLTPRDVSIMRYTKHSDWMEELMASPFATSQILPVSLGLGRSGALRDLTKDFDAPTEYSILPDGEEYPEEDDPDDAAEDTDAAEDIAEPIPASKVSDLAARAEAQLARFNAEMETMKREHEVRLAQLGRTAAVREAESRLRAADTPEAVEAAQRDAEKLLGCPIVSTSKFQCLQRGGLVDRTPSPSPQPEDTNALSQEGAEGPVGAEDTEMPDGGEFVDDSAFADFTNADGPEFDMDGAEEPPSVDAAAGPQGEADWELISRGEAASAPASAGLPPGPMAQAMAASAAEPAPPVPAADPVAVSAPSIEGVDTAMDLGDSMIDFGDDADNAADDGLDAGEGGEFEAATAGDFGEDIDFGDLGGEVEEEIVGEADLAPEQDAEGGLEQADDEVAPVVPEVPADPPVQPVPSAAPEETAVTAPAGEPVAEQQQPEQPQTQPAPLAEAVEAAVVAEQPVSASQAEISETSFADEAFGDAFGQS